MASDNSLLPVQRQAIIFTNRDSLCSLVKSVEDKFYTKHGSITAVLSSNFRNDSTNEMDVPDEQDFAIIWVWGGFWKDIPFCNSPDLRDLFVELFTRLEGIHEIKDV